MIIVNNLPMQYSEQIVKIAEAWTNILKAYETKYNSTDSIHWYQERTNIGALAAAVWISGGLAIEEYGSNKGIEKKYTGRNDLYFHIDDIKAVAEAKLVWIKTGYRKNFKVMLSNVIKDSITPIDTAIENAEKDSNKVISDHQKFIILFANSYYKPHHTEDDSTIKIIENHFEKLDSALVVKFKTSKNLISSKGNICNTSYMIIAKR